jgi:hypothetical protein
MDGDRGWTYYLPGDVEEVAKHQADSPGGEQR